MLETKKKQQINNQIIQLLEAETAVIMNDLMNDYEEMISALKREMEKNHDLNQTEQLIKYSTAFVVQHIAGMMALNKINTHAQVESIAKSISENNKNE